MMKLRAIPRLFQAQIFGNRLHGFDAEGDVGFEIDAEIGCACEDSSRWTLRAKALSFIFLRTDLASTRRATFPA